MDSLGDLSLFLEKLLKSCTPTGYGVSSLKPRDHGVPCCLRGGCLHCPLMENSLRFSPSCRCLEVRWVKEQASTHIYVDKRSHSTSHLPHGKTDPPALSPACLLNLTCGISIWMWGWGGGSRLSQRPTYCPYTDMGSSSNPCCCLLQENVTQRALATLQVLTMVPVTLNRPPSPPDTGPPPLQAVHTTPQPLPATSPPHKALSQRRGFPTFTICP